MHKKLLLYRGLILYILFGFGVNFAQSVPIKFDRLTKEKGFTQSSAISILQDNDGFIWFGSYGGLTRYDASAFIDFRAYAIDEHSLPDNTIHDICQDNEGNLWLATNGGLVCYNKVFNTFKTFKNIKGDSSSLAINSVRSLLIDSDGLFWIGTYGAGLNLFDKSTGKFKRFPHSKNDKKSISNDFISAMIEDSKGRIWICTDGGLNLLDKESYTFKVYDHDANNKNSLSKNNAVSITEGDDGVLWIGTWGGGLNKFNPDTEKFTHYKYSKANPLGISSNVISALLFDSQKRLWVGTYDNGLELFNNTDNSFQHFRVSYSDEHTIGDNSIVSLYEDKVGNIWIGTKYTGASVIDVYRNQFEHYNVKIEDKYSLNNKLVSAISMDAKGKIWIGTVGGGINVFDKYSYRFNHISLEFGNDQRNSIRSILVDSKQKVWVSSTTGLTILNNDGTLNKLYGYQSGSNTPTDYDVFNIYEDTKKNIWLTTWQRGVFQLNTVTGEYYNYSTFEDSKIKIQANSILTIYEAKDGKFYLASDHDGLIVLDLVNNTSKQYKHIQNDSTSISNDQIYCFAEDRAGNLYIGTDLGLNRVSSGDTSFSVVGDTDFMKNSVIMGIIPDGDYFWISTAYGLIKYDVQLNKSHTFFEDDGIQANEFLMRSCLKDSSGRLYFGGVNGLTSFMPKEIKSNRNIPKVVITAVSINDKPLNVGEPVDSKIILDSSIVYKKGIELNHNQNYLTFKFSALNYNSPTRNHYQYKLDGYDDNWTYLDQNREVYYTNVDPGEYTFEVMGSNNAGMWNNKPAKISVVILPPFWKTAWFKLLGVILFVLLIYMAVRLRLKAINNQNLKLQNEVAIQTAQLKEKNEQLKKEVSIRTKAEKEIQRHLEDIEASRKTLAKRTEELSELNEKLKESEKVLKELNVSKDKFFSIIAHDLRNPFTTLLGYTTLLKEDYDQFAEEDIRESIDSINKMANVVYDLLDNLLKWSGIQTGRMIYMPESLQIGKLVTKTFILNKETAAVKNIKLIQNIDSNIHVYADKLMLETVIRNLVSNALKFTHESGTISVSASENFDGAKIIIEDTGVGISKDNLANLFRIDVNHSTEGTNKEKGSGLGLILCKELIEKNFGTIDVESQVNKGSKFIITLPTANNKEEQISA